MSTEESRIRIRHRVGNVRVAVATAEERAAAEEHARIAEDEARWTRIREETLETIRRQWTEHFRGALERLATERERLRETRDELLAMLEPHVLDLSLEIARKLVAQELSEGRVEIRPIVETVLRELREPDSPAVVALSLNPEDYAALSAEDGLTAVAGVQVSADSSVERGGCVVTTDGGRIDSDLASRVRSIRRALRLPAETESGVTP